MEGSGGLPGTSLALGLQPLCRGCSICSPCQPGDLPGRTAVCQMQKARGQLSICLFSQAEPIFRGKASKLGFRQACQLWVG